MWKRAGKAIAFVSQARCQNFRAAWHSDFIQARVPLCGPFHLRSKLHASTMDTRGAKPVQRVTRTRTGILLGLFTTHTAL